MLNSPAFESWKRLPRTGLPRYSFIILQSFQTNSDTVWVIINHSQCSAPAQLSSACSSLAYKTFKINSIAKFISVNYAILEGEEEGKKFPETSEGFLLTLPPQRPSGEGTSHSLCVFPRNGLWFQFYVPKVNTAACQISLLPGEEAQRMLHTKPFRWWCLTAVGVAVGSPEQFVPPACKASRPRCHPTAWYHNPAQTSAEIECVIQLQTHNPSGKAMEGVGVGWKRQPGTRHRIFSLRNPQRGCNGCFGHSSLSLPLHVLFPVVPSWRACSGDRARLSTPATSTE